MGSSRGKNQEKVAETRFNTAYDDYKADPLEKYRSERTMNFMKEFDSGKDVKDMEAVSPYYNLFQNAKNAQMNGQIGKGVVALGQNPNSDRQVSDQDKYLQSQREQNASGMLYDATNNAYNGAMNESQFLINTAQNRAGNRLNTAGNMYSNILNRPKQPSLFERIMGIATGAGRTAASLGVNFGGGGG